MYDGTINLVDDQIPFLCRELERLGLTKVTFLAVTGDHGEAFCEHSIVEHTECGYNEVLMVPLILTGPGLPTHTRVPSQVRTIDIMPTLLDVCEVTPPFNIQGVSLVPWIFGRRQDHLFAVTESERRGGLRAIQNGHHKLIQRIAEARVELYNLTTDSSELNDLSQSEPVLRSQLEEALASWAYQSRKIAPRFWFRSTIAETREVSAEVVDRLRDLGYLE